MNASARAHQQRTPRLRAFVASAQRTRRFSMILALLLYCLAAISVIVSAHSVAAYFANIVENPTLKFVEVTGVQSSAGAHQPLTVGDRDQVASLVSTRAGTNDTHTSWVYRLNTSVSVAGDDEDTPFFLVGMEPELMQALELPSGEASSVVVHEASEISGPVELDVPVIEVEADGMSSRELSRAPITAVPGLPDALARQLSPADPHTSAVTSTSTFQDFSETMTGLPFDQLESALDGDDPRQDLMRTHLWVAVPDDFTSRDVALWMMEDGYVASDPTAAFDDLPTTLLSLAALTTAFSVIAIASAIWLTNANNANFMRLSGRDIATLTWMGFAPDVIEGHYRSRLVRDCLPVIIITGVIATTGAMLVGTQSTRLWGGLVAAALTIALPTFALVRASARETTSAVHTRGVFSDHHERSEFS